MAAWRGCKGERREPMRRSAGGQSAVAAGEGRQIEADSPGRRPERYANQERTGSGLETTAQIGRHQIQRKFVQPLIGNPQAKRLAQHLQAIKRTGGQ